jgi:hypothetical protein
MCDNENTFVEARGALGGYFVRTHFKIPTPRQKTYLYYISIVRWLKVKSSCAFWGMQVLFRVHMLTYDGRPCDGVNLYPIISSLTGKGV